jgi:hypothetical protein
VVEVVDPGEDAGAGADGRAAGSQQRGEFAVDVGVIVDDSRRLILAVRAARDRSGTEPSITTR